MYLPFVSSYKTSAAPHISAWYCITCPHLGVPGPGARFSVFGLNQWLSHVSRRQNHLEGLLQQTDCLLVLLPGTSAAAGLGWGL